MKLHIPLAIIGLLVSTAAVHPQPYDRGPPPPPMDYAVPPPEEAPPPRRMICVIDTPFPGHQETCPTHVGYPGSPCRCAGSFFDGERTFLD